MDEVPGRFEDTGGAEAMQDGVIELDVLTMNLRMFVVEDFQIVLPLLESVVPADHGASCPGN